MFGMNSMVAMYVLELLDIRRKNFGAPTEKGKIMVKFPTMDEFAKEVAEKALDDFEYEGKTIREWVQMILCGDVVPVVHGRWIEHSHLEVGGECSVCGWQFQWFENAEAHYCPHCGAKMDGGSKDGK